MRDSGREGEEKAATFKFDSKGGKIGMGSKASKISNAKGDKKYPYKTGLIEPIYGKMISSKIWSVARAVHVPCVTQHAPNGFSWS